MARKFIQMGMTRAKRYANHAGGRKYSRPTTSSSSKRTELPKSKGHKGQEEKLAASEVFREVWKRCTSHEEYVQLRDEWKAERKGWDRGEGRGKKEEKAGIKEEDEAGSEVEVKEEEDGDD
ncbi:hypothetical protein PRZ48_014220 [Zasmidium cellare]|uniref:HMG box domain-containing protein n=1 Tax=Zasmidium cellare TaxID=395010 RepID=A0ABR0E0M2_ZASCE|nr:hypothetical protein PRZ48_014220 [Zasmidium cellare]